MFVTSGSVYWGNPYTSRVVYMGVTFTWKTHCLLDMLSFSLPGSLRTVLSPELSAHGFCIYAATIIGTKGKSACFFRFFSYFRIKESTTTLLLFIGHHEEVCHFLSIGRRIVSKAFRWLLPEHDEKFVTVFGLNLTKNTQLKQIHFRQTKMWTIDHVQWTSKYLSDKLYVCGRITLHQDSV